MSKSLNIHLQDQRGNAPRGETKHRVELWDQMHLIFQQYNDHQLHGVLYFSGFLDLDCLKKAVLITMKQLPELSSRYVEDILRPYWKEIHPLPDEVVTCVNSHDQTTEIETFLTCQTDTFAGPQIKVRVVRTEKNDTLCILMNHMISDGAGFKEYLYMLAETYTRLKRNPALSPAYKIGGSRSVKQVVKQIGLKNRIKALLMPDYQPKKSGQFFFPLCGEAGEVPCLLSFKLNSTRFEKIKQYGKKANATINDIVFAAFIRVLCTMLDVKDDTPISVSCIMDLRHYLPDKKADEICNLTSTILCNIDFKAEESFSETVVKVKRTMDRQKSQLPGLKGLLLLDIVFSLFPYKIAQKMISRHFVNPLTSISNIGIIDDSQLIFDTLCVEDAFITGAVKFYPYFLLALSSFRNTATFTVCLNGTDKDKRRVEKFFTLLDNELKMD
ncbi:WS/DGAT domain-containing protein [Acetobacterium tundrae]|uniref:DUF1298 domain-containing protein n=1 Tax=Acetobacterium tundrae TaxID=132932 RepID=A0ABR6WPK3_9FIRM|nr:WS/DGAT domain-containing protein [Acetobacterium tundrae]MBC3798223.1 DUF1298 domain-containing protein [Acetobacterium tundrae]